MGNTLRLWHNVRSDGGGSLHNRRPAVSTNPCAVTVTFYSQQAASIRVPDPSSNLRSSSTKSRPFRSAPRCAPSNLEEEHVPNRDRFIASCRIHRFLFGERIALKQAAAILIPKIPPSPLPKTPMTGRHTDCPLKRIRPAVRCVTNLPSKYRRESEAKRILARPTGRGSHDRQSVWGCSD